MSKSNKPNNNPSGERWERSNKQNNNSGGDRVWDKSNKPNNNPSGDRVWAKSNKQNNNSGGDWEVQFQPTAESMNSLLDFYSSNRGEYEWSLPNEGEKVNIQHGHCTYHQNKFKNEAFRHVNEISFIQTVFNLSVSGFKLAESKNNEWMLVAVLNTTDLEEKFFMEINEAIKNAHVTVAKYKKGYIKPGVNVMDIMNDIHEIERKLDNLAATSGLSITFDYIRAFKKGKPNDNDLMIFQPLRPQHRELSIRQYPCYGLSRWIQMLKNTNEVNLIENQVENLQLNDP